MNYSTSFRNVSFIFLALSVVSILSAPGDIVWSYLTKGWIVTTPIEASNVIYFPSQDGNIYALDSVSGEKVFSVHVGYEIVSTPVFVSSTSTLIYACTNSMVYGLNTNTGTIQWTANITLIQNTIIPLQIVTDPVLSLDSSMVYVTTSSIPGVGQLATNYIVALSTTTGARLWYNTTASSIFSTPVLSQDGGKLFVADSTTVVYSVNILNGYYDWQQTLPRAVVTPLAVDSDQVFAVDNQGIVNALFTFSGVSQWTQSLYPSTTIGYPTLWNPTNNLYVSCRNGNVFALSGTNNGVFVWPTFWSMQNNDLFFAPPAVGITPGTSTNVTVYVPSSDGCIYAVNDATNGTLTWTTCTEGELRSSPLLDSTNNMLYIGSLDGRLYAISTI